MKGIQNVGQLDACAEPSKQKQADNEPADRVGCRCTSCLSKLLLHLLPAPHLQLLAQQLGSGLEQSCLFQHVLPCSEAAVLTGTLMRTAAEHCCYRRALAMKPHQRCLAAAAEAAVQQQAAQQHRCCCPLPVAVS